MLIGLIASAYAGTVVYSEDFGSVADTSSFAGTDGWETGYAPDPWAVTGGWVHATTDHDTGTWGDGGAIDDHLVQRGEIFFDDFTLDTRITNTRDDSIGVVFRFQDAANFYVAFFARGGSMPDVGTGGRATGSGGRLYRVSGGSATELAATGITFTRGQIYDLRIVASGSAIEVWLDADRDGTFQTGNRVLAATDTTFGEGSVGAYCFDSGGDGCAFDHLTVSVDDFDGDGIDASIDCDDTDATVGDTLTWYDDLDGDGLGDDSTAEIGCTGATGQVLVGGDCDDGDATVTVGTTWYLDADLDGHGDPDVAVVACEAPADYVAGDGDCDDGDANVNPDAAEVWYDGVDQDCDGAGDLDQDGDGHDAAAHGGDDCDDTDPATRPGGIEVWYDGADQDCDGNDGDRDGDGHDAVEAGGGDCDDRDSGIHPDAAEIVDDGVDQDCDGEDALDEDDRGGCGCVSAPGGVGWGLVGLVALIRRVRRPARPRRSRGSLP